MLQRFHGAGKLQVAQPQNLLEDDLMNVLNIKGHNVYSKMVPLKYLEEDDDGNTKEKFRKAGKTCKSGGVQTLRERIREFEAEIEVLDREIEERIY